MIIRNLVRGTCRYLSSYRFFVQDKNISRASNFPILTFFIILTAKNSFVREKKYSLSRFKVEFLTGYRSELSPSRNIFFSKFWFAKWWEQKGRCDAVPEYKDAVNRDRYKSFRWPQGPISQGQRIDFSKFSILRADRPSSRLCC